MISQTLHSIEEFYFSLWDVLPIARFVSLLINDNVVVGFVLINTSIILFGFWIYFVPLSRHWSTWRIFLWPWVLLELGNGIGHVVFAMLSQGYFPGIYSAPLLLVLSCYLVLKLLQSSDEPSVA